MPLQNATDRPDIGNRGPHLLGPQALGDGLCPGKAQRAGLGQALAAGQGCQFHLGRGSIVHTSRRSRARPPVHLIQWLGASPSQPPLQRRECDAECGRDLTEEPVVILYLDAIALRVRLDRKVVSVPVLVALGVRADGQKVVLDVETLTSESTTAWSGFVESLIARGLRRPQLCVLDGSPGLRAAVETNWPGLAVQRCVVHKLRNLERHAPQHAREELTADYHRITEAESGALARQAYHAFVAKWEKRLPKVVTSLREAGEELLTCSRLPSSQWKCVRSTNAIERLNEEFRRRVKTQGALPTAQTAELLFYGLLLTGQIRTRRIDGWREMLTISTALATTVAA